MRSFFRRILPDYTHPENPAVRAAYGRFAGLLGIAVNALLFLGKLFAGLFSGSVSVTADAFNNLSDASSSVISLLGFHMANRPADEEHPFGHGRYEYLAGLFIAIIIILIGVELLKTSIDKLLFPTEVSFSWITVVIMVFSIFAKLGLLLVNRRIGTFIHSQALIASASDSRNDIITTSAILLASLISHYTNLQLDSWMGLVAAGFILVSSIGLIKDTLDPLLGHAPDPTLVEDIQKRIMSYPGVLGTHDLIVHDYGPGRQFISAHVEVAAEEDVLVSHDIIDNIERELQERLHIHVVLHLDPIQTSCKQANDMRTWLSQKIRTIHPQMTIHDLRLVVGPTHTNLIFDCVVPHDLKMTDSEVRSAISTLVKREHPDCNCVVTIDRNYASVPH